MKLRLWVLALSISGLLATAGPTWAAPASKVKVLTAASGRVHRTRPSARSDVKTIHGMQLRTVTQRGANRARMIVRAKRAGGMQFTNQQYYRKARTTALPTALPFTN